MCCDGRDEFGCELSSFSCKIDWLIVLVFSPSTKKLLETGVFFLTANFDFLIGAEAAETAAEAEVDRPAAAAAFGGDVPDGADDETADWTVVSRTISKAKKSNKKIYTTLYMHTFLQVTH